MPHIPGHDFPTKRDPRTEAIKAGQRIFNPNKKNQKTTSARQQKTPTVLKANTTNTEVQKARQKKAAPSLTASNLNANVGKWEKVWELGEAMRIEKEERKDEFMRLAEEALAEQPQGQEEESGAQVEKAERKIMEGKNLAKQQKRDAAMHQKKNQDLVD